MEWRCHAAQDALGNPVNAPEIDQFAQDQDEFISARTRQGIGLTNADLQAVGDFLQQSVPDVVTQGVIDIFEMVKVEKHQGQMIMHPVGFMNGLLQPVNEQTPIGQPGQRVNIGLLEDDFLRMLLFRDVHYRRKTGLPGRVGACLNRDPAVIVAHLKHYFAVLCAITDTGKHVFQKLVEFGPVFEADAISKRLPR